LLLETALLPIPMLRDDPQVGPVRIGRDERLESTARNAH
jgi:hypothetical protein